MPQARVRRRREAAAQQKYQKKGKGDPDEE